MHNLVLGAINLHTKYEMPIFIRSKHMKKEGWFGRLGHSESSAMSQFDTVYMIPIHLS